MSLMATPDSSRAHIRPEIHVSFTCILPRRGSFFFVATPLFDTNYSRKATSKARQMSCEVAEFDKATLARLQACMRVRTRFLGFS